MPSWDEFQPFIVTGLALGGVYALSGVGLVVLYRTTGVLNLAFGAVGAMGALIAWELINNAGWDEYPAYLICILFGGVVTLAYGLLFGPPLANRDPLVKATASLGLALILLGTMSWIWSDKARSMILPTSNENFMVSDVLVNYTQVIGFAFGVVVTLVTAAFLRYTGLGTAMRALANDREITATLGVPVRRVEAAAWLGSGLLAGVAGLLLSNLVGLDATTLTFLVISSLAAALIARLQSLVVTLVAGIVVGLVNALITPILSISEYRDMTPFVLAIVALLWLSRHREISVSRSAG
jgi:branched-chain amino acid transport system permease protein